MEENIKLTVIMICLQLTQSINYHRMQIGQRCEGGWTCSTLEYCLEKLDIPSAKPQICSFSDRSPIMCCPPEPSLYARSVVMGKCEKYEDECADCKIKGKMTNSISSAMGSNPRARTYRYMVLIGYGDLNSIEWLCAGSIISHHFILSAAHCAQKGHSKRSIARWIKLDDQKGSNPEIMRIKQRIMHPDYTAPLLYHDIALYRLDRAVVFNSRIQPVCLSTELSHVYPHAASTLTGLALNHFDEKRREHQSIEVYTSVIDSKVCNRLVRDEETLPNGVDSESMLCAVQSQLNNDPCLGGLCSSLVINSTSSNLKIQIGIQTSKALGVYTKICDYLPWIQSVVWP